MKAGRMIGVGAGPGDPELMTMKAARAVRNADAVVWFAKKGRQGNARRIVDRWIAESSAEPMPLYYPYTVEIPATDARYRDAMREFYDNAARQIVQRIEAGQCVAVICEGDPMLYGSYLYLHDRIAPGYETEVIPGVTSFSGCAASAKVPLVSTDRTFSVVPGTLSEECLEDRLRQDGAFVIIKLGRNLGKVRRVLRRLGKLARATYVERGTTDAERIVPLADNSDDCGAYFSLVIIPDHTPTVDGAGVRAVPT